MSGGVRVRTPSCCGENEREGAGTDPQLLQLVTLEAAAGLRQPQTERLHFGTYRWFGRGIDCERIPLELNRWWCRIPLEMVRSRYRI
jgi:hypothetical protein